jgi:uncharacterized peroxidase-related enzyme
MSRFKQITDPSHNPELESLYKEIVAHGVGASTPINWFTAQAERPDILRTTWGLFRGILLQGMLPPTVKQMISMTIAMQNNCRYCAVAHTSALEGMGVPTEVIQSCASDPDLAQIPPPQRAMVKFGLKAAKNPKSVTDKDVQTLIDHGLTEGEIMEVVMVASCANFLDTWADVSGILVDGEEGSTTSTKNEAGVTVQ